MNKREKEISKENPTYGVEKRTRHDWGSINPITRVEESRKHKKPKHIKRERERYLEE